MRDDERKKLQGTRLAAARLAAGFKSGREAALSNGWTESSYRSHENGTRTIGQDDAEKYARTYRLLGVNVDAARILFGTERDRAAAEAAQSLPNETSADSATLRAARFVRPIYGGVVEAGPFRPVEDFDDDPERVIPSAEEDPRYPGVPIISFDVAGDSMNALRPTPILPGMRVLAIDFEGLKNRVPLRDGMVVVVEQTLQGGHLRERSVKQLEMHRDRTEFCPRSTNPRHKPIVVPFETVDQGDEDGREVKVLAIVVQFVSDAPGW